jgi:hypothetical protein
MQADYGLLQSRIAGRSLCAPNPRDCMRSRMSDPGIRVFYQVVACALSNGEGECCAEEVPRLHMLSMDRHVGA